MILHALLGTFVPYIASPPDTAHPRTDTNTDTAARTVPREAGATTGQTMLSNRPAFRRDEAGTGGCGGLAGRGSTTPELRRSMVSREP